MSLRADLRTLREAGVLRPLGPRTTLALTRQLLREGVKPHLLYTIHGTRDASKPAVLSADATTTWGQLLDRTRRLANHFIESGVGPQNGVAVMLPNRREFIEANAAGLRAGATVSYINPRMPGPDAEALVERTKSKLLVTHRDDVGKAERVLRVGDDFEAAIAGASPNEPRVDRAAKGDIVIFTSGTTGRPKGAIRSLEEGASLGALAGFLRTIPLRTDDINMVVCPLYHSSGSGFLTMAQVLGNPVVLVEKFSPEAFCQAVADHRVTSTVVVPTMLHQIASWPGAREYDLSSLRVVICTGAPLREEVRAEARELLGDVVYDLFGSTEMGWVSVASPQDQLRKPGSVGKPVPGIELRITGEDLRPLPEGERGEIWARSALAMKGYVDDPELNAERIREGFISVKDVGYLDSDGYLFVVDRADDMIISGGVNVYPAETEIVLNAHPRVDESSVLGVSDDKWGERIVAAAVPAGEVTPEELVDWCKDNASYAAVPKDVKLVESLPRNDIGKVDKRKLAELWA